MEIAYMPLAEADINYFKKTGDKTIQRKITQLTQEMQIHPETGTGKPERLKGTLSGYWSRRINGEHRIIYTIDYDKNRIEVYSLRGHYEK